MGELQKKCEEFMSLANSSDPNLAHISCEEKSRASQECQTVIQWLQDKIELHRDEPKSQDSSLTIDEIAKTSEKLEKVCRSIFDNTPPKLPIDEKCSSDTAQTHASQKALEVD